MPWNPDGTRKSSTYKMKYSNSAFPFKSPHKQWGMPILPAGNVMGVTGQNTGRYQDWGMPSNHPSRRGRGINPNIVSGTVSVM